MIVLSWKKGLFRCVYQLFANGNKIGQLKEKRWSQSAIGVSGGKNILFRVKNSFVQSTDIIDIESGLTIGRIKYNCWWPKAKVEMEGKTYSWSFTNIWTTKWKIADEENNEVKFSGHSVKGQVYSPITDSKILLTGLFIANYYWQLHITYLACVFALFFIPWL
ncbi:hypothetical protein E1176_09315 [Fulvivirga sp. RKSG066]|nr:hypothetical protein [Fulvivirga aurantia]